MPPSALPSNQSQDTSHMLPRHAETSGGSGHEGHRASGIGPWIGAIIIVIVLAFGALYFYGEYLNSQAAQESLPLIQGNVAL